MILRIAKKEFVDAWRDGRFRLGAVLVALLLVAAGLLARHQVERTRAERDAAAALEQKNWLEQGDKNSHSAGHYGVHAFKPVAPLSVFDRGVEPFVGTTVFLEAHRMNQAGFLPAQDATAMRRFGELTAAAGLQMLVPLFIVLLAFGTVSLERERGTLRQVLSLGISPRALVLGKTLGLGFALVALLVPLAIVGAVLLAQVDGASSEGTWQRAAGLALAYGLYLAVVLVGSVAVSALAPNARSALAILLALWVANCVLAPRLVSDLVHGSLPSPSLATFEKEMQEDVQKGLDGHDPRSKRMEDFTKRTLEEHGKKRVEELPFNFHGLVMLESERMANEVYDHHFGKLWDRLAEQDRAVTLAGIASPMLALRSASMAFAGTDFAHHRRFAQSAELHRREFVRILNEDLAYNARPGDHSYTAGRSLWEKLPPFQMSQLPPAEVFAHARTALAVLGAWFVAAFAFLFFAAGRVRVQGA